jgi:small conductance mechanosensitive channel
MDETASVAIEEVTRKAIEYTNADRLLQVATEHGTDIGLKIIAAAAIFIIGRWFARIVTRLVRTGLRRSGMEITLEKFLCDMLSALLTIVVLIAAIGALGVQTTSLLAVLGAAGLAVGLALQGSLSNFAAGVLIVAFRPYKVDDIIEAGGVTGTVRAVAIFTTIINTVDNKKIIVPNSQIMNGIIINYSANDKRRVDMLIGCGYQNDLDKVRTVLNKIMESDPRILKTPAPTIGVTALGETSVNLVVRPWVKTADYWDVYFYVHEQIKKDFDAAGIIIPIPPRDVHIYPHGPAA